MQNGRFPDKIALRLKKVCYKVFLCENHQRRSCKALFAYLSVYKWLVVEVPLNVNFALSKPLLGLAAVLSRIVTNTLFALQLLQRNIKLLTLLIY